MADDLTIIAQRAESKIVAESGTKEASLPDAIYKAWSLVPQWAKEEMAGRVYVERDIIDRLPAEDSMSLDDEMKSICSRSIRGLKLLVARGPDPRYAAYRIAGYDNHYTELTSVNPATGMSRAVEIVLDGREDARKVIDVYGIKNLLQQAMAKLD